MSGIKGKAILLSGVAAALVFFAGQAQAGGFALREQSPTAQGSAFAGVAAGAGGLSSMFWNPAAMTKYQGWNSQSALRCCCLIHK